MHFWPRGLLLYGRKVTDLGKFHIRFTITVPIEFSTGKQFLEFAAKVTPYGLSVAWFSNFFLYIPLQVRS